MNIFVLDEDPRLAAQYHCDNHVVKMILESAQLLSTAHHVLDCEKPIIYKATHVNHPCSKWVRESKMNYQWLYELFSELCYEYFFRYDKIHATDAKLKTILKDAPYNILDAPKTDFVLAMPDDCKEKDPVSAYRKYYKTHKQHLFRWKKRDEPWWLK